MVCLMVRRCSSNLLKMKSKSLFLLLLISLFGQAEAQVLELKRAFLIEKPISVSADAQGNIFLSTMGGEIHKYTSAGELLNTFSPQSAGYFNVLDASAGLQVKAFNENSQTIIYLDRFLNQTASFQLPAERFNFVSALTWSAGNTIWVADAAEMQLVNWRIDTREVIRTLNLNQYISDERFEIKSLQEHQHKLYLFSPRRLYVFDQLGNYEKQIALPQWEDVTFKENELVILGKNTLTFLHLYRTEERKIALPKEGQYEHLTFSRGELCLFSDDEAHIYRMVP